MEKIEQSKGRKGQKGRTQRDITFMRHVARTYIEGNQSLNQLVEVFNVPNQTISRWVQRFSSELEAEITISPMTEQEQKDLKILQKYKEDKERTFLIHQLEFLITDYRNLKGEKTEIDNNMI